MDKIDKGWRETHLLQLDNASIHTGRASKQIMADLEVPVIYTAPGSFMCSPIERVFGFIKVVKLDLELMETWEEMTTTNKTKKKKTKKEILCISISKRLQ